MVSGLGLEQLDIWACELLKWRTPGSSGERRGFWCTRAAFEMPVRYPPVDVSKQLEFGEDIWAGDSYVEASLHRRYVKPRD